MNAERNLQWGAMVESPRCDPSGGQGAIQARPNRLAPGNFENWNFENAISCDLVFKFSCSSGKFAGFGNPMVQERRTKLHLLQKWGACPHLAPPAPRSLINCKNGHTKREKLEKICDKCSLGLYYIPIIASH